MLRRIPPKNMEVARALPVGLHWNLKRKGKPIPTNDMWIAASSLQHGLALFTLDAHYNAVDGLMLT